MFRQPIKKKENKSRVLIVGAGIMGMTVAYHFLKNGYDHVDIVSKDEPLKTNSDVAAALWRPYGAKPEKDALKWSDESYSQFFDIYYDYLKKKAAQGNQIDPIENPGISFVTDVEYFGPEVTTKPDWMISADKLLGEKITRLKQDQNASDPIVRQAASEMLALLEKQQAQVGDILKNANDSTSRPHRYASVVPLIDSTIYRKWLLNQYETLSKKKVKVNPDGIQSLEVNSKSFSDLSQDYDIILNCAGEQARHLSSEGQTKPIRGLVVVTKIPPHLNYCVGVEPNPSLDNGEIRIVYAIIRPDSQTCIVGGTYEETEDAVLSDENKILRDAETIMQRALAYIPGINNIKDFDIVNYREGFRCGRDEMLTNVNVVFAENGKPMLLGASLGSGGGGYSISHGVSQHLVTQCMQLSQQLQAAPAEENRSGFKKS